MTDSNVTPMTNADRDRAALAADAADGVAKMAGLVAARENSAEVRLERGRAEWERLQLDPDHLGQVAAGNPAAVARETAVRANIAVASEEVAKLQALDRIEAAFDPTADPANRPAGVDFTTPESSVPLRDMQQLVADDRAHNVDPAISQERFLGNRNPPKTKADARRQLQTLTADPAWQEKVSRNDPATMEELLELSLVARAGPNEPAWSLPIYGSRTA